MSENGRISCCRECVPPERHMGCHGTCKRYLAEKKAHEEELERIRAWHEELRDVNDYTRGSVDKMRRGKRCWNYKKVRGQR